MRGVAGPVDHGHPVVGVIRLPFLGQLYTAERDHGAYEDGRRLQVSATTELRDAIVAIGDYAVGDGADGKNRARLELTRYLAEQAQRVRMLGTAAIDLAWVAAGKLDASLTLSNKRWTWRPAPYSSRKPAAGSSTATAPGTPRARPPPSLPRRPSPPSC